MKRIASALLCIAIISSTLLSSCGKSTSKDTTPASDQETVTTEPSTIPSQDVTITPIDFSDPVVSDPGLDWQYDISFPDWQDRSMYGANNRLGFYGYSGQGVIYIQPGAGSGKFSLYINDTRIDTSEMAPGKVYSLDISGITRNGRNSLQLSDLSQGVVFVKIPYPTVISGTIQDVGISEDAIRLIDTIISCDVESGFPSSQMAVVKDGRMVYENSWGNVKTYDDNANPIDASPVTKDTLYDLASVTKMFSVNFAIQYLMTKEQITLDTKIVDILGDEFAGNTIERKYYNRDKIPLSENKKMKANITVRDVLRHQAGFPSGPQNMTNQKKLSTSPTDATRKDTLKQIFMTPLMYEPGTELVYSDLDYMLLDFCVEEITGMRIDQYLEEIFWKPMGLTHITYNPMENGFSADDCAATELKPYPKKGEYTDEGLRNRTLQGEVHDSNAFHRMAGVSGHAGLFSNASDLAILASVMLTGGYGNHRFFSQNVIDQFTSVQDEDYPGYALGWWREGDHARDYYFGSVTDSKVFGHEGFTGTLVVIDPENNMVIVLLTNKLHSKVLDADTYSGSMYTTATLGFVPEIIEIGLNGEADKGIWASMAGDIAADIKRRLDKDGITDEDYPRWRAYKAMLETKKRVSS